MAGTPPGGKWLFSESVQALSDLKSQFKALDHEAHELTVRLLYLQTPLPCEPVTPLDRRLTDRGDWVWCLPGENPNDMSPESIAERASTLAKEKIDLRFDALVTTLGSGPHLASWEAETGQAGLIPCQRRFFASGNPNEVHRLLSIANESSALIANVIEKASSPEARVSLWPDVPNELKLAVHAGYWVDLVFEVGRWRLASVGIRCEAEAPEVVCGKLDKRSSQLSQSDIDYSATDFWTKLEQPPYKQMTLAGFAAKSAAMMGLLIHWGKTGINPWQCRVDAQWSQHEYGFDADGPRQYPVDSNLRSIITMGIQRAKDVRDSLLAGEIPTVRQADLLRLDSDLVTSWMENHDDFMVSDVVLFREAYELTRGLIALLANTFGKDTERLLAEISELAGASWMDLFAAMRLKGISSSDSTPLIRSEGETKANEPATPPLAGQAAPAAEEDDAGREQPNLRPCDIKAGAQYQRAMEDNPNLKTVQEVYDWFVEHLADEDETLPSIETWGKYVRKHRATSGGQKNQRGVGHETRSVVSGAKIEQQNRTEADFR